MVRWFGKRQGLAIWWANRFGADGDIKIQSLRVRHPLYLRLRTSDFRIYGQVMMQVEYALPLRNPPRVIVDAGANIGLTAIYLANRYPNARILAVEPDKGSFRQLCKNIAAYPRVTPICAALWSTSGQMSWTGTPDRYGNRRIQVPDGLQQAPVIGQVDTITMPQLMAAHQVEFIDLLKVDIEGAEQEVFSTAEPWIDRVGVIIAEMHDRYLPGCTVVFNSATRDFDLEWRQGEHIVVARRDFIQFESPAHEDSLPATMHKGPSSPTMSTCE
jgi:FkbM family methyltransferase